MWFPPILAACDSETSLAVQVAPVTQALQLPAEPATVDVLWMLDSSCSMGIYARETLPDQHEALGRWLSETEEDYRFGLLLTHGLLDLEQPTLTALVTPEDPDPEAALERGLLQMTSDGTPTLMRIAWRYLDSPRASELRRPGARLAVVLVSDRDEQGLSGREFASLMMAEVGQDPELLSVSAVVPGNLAACPPQHDSRAAPELVQAARLTGGPVEDLCGDAPAQAVQSVLNRAVGLPDRFLLSETPRTGSVRVTVSGRPVPCPGRWTVGPVAGEAGTWLVFEPHAAPPRGADVEVTYTPGASPWPERVCDPSW